MHPYYICGISYYNESMNPWFWSTEASNPQNSKPVIYKTQVIAWWQDNPEKI